jgi:predicted nucleic acid-binding protein
MNVVYDAGVLVAADRNERETWADHRVRLELGIVPTTTAPVVAQVSRTARQSQLRRFLKGCEIIGFAPGDAHAVGALMSRRAITDVVDAHLVFTAVQRRAVVVTANRQGRTS